MSLRYLCLRDLPIVIDEGTFTYLRDLVGYYGTTNKGPCMASRYLCLRDLPIIIVQSTLTFLRDLVGY
jgi:hypothetical protein